MAIGIYSSKREILFKVREKKHRSSVQYAILALVVAGCLGEVFNIFGIKLSWIMTLMTVIFFIFEYFNKKIIISTTEIKKYLYFFVIWFYYASFQMIFIYQNAYAFSTYFSLLINIFMVIIIAINIHSIDDLIFINKGIILGLIINLIIAFWEIITGNHLVTQYEVHYNPPIGVYGNVNDFGTFICLGIVSIVLNFAITKKYIVINITLIIASIFVLLQTQSRATIYGMLLYGLSFVLITFLLKLSRKSKFLFALVTSMLAFVILTIGMFILAANSSIDELVMKISSSGNEASDMLRLRLIKDAFKGFIESAFLGVGPGQSIVLLGTNVHNFFLEIMSEYGIVITGGVLMIFIYFLSTFKWKLPIFLSACVMSFPPAFLLIGISSSGANRIRATWIMITIMFIAISLFKKERKKISVNESG